MNAQSCRIRLYPRVSRYDKMYPTESTGHYLSLSAVIASDSSISDATVRLIHIDRASCAELVYERVKMKYGYGKTCVS